MAVYTADLRSFVRNAASPAIDGLYPTGNRFVASTLYPLQFTPDLLFDANSSTLGGSIANFGGGGAIAQNYRVAEGSKAMEFSIASGSYGPWGGEIFFSSAKVKGDVIHAQISMYMPTDFDWTSTGEGNHIKFLRYRTESAAGGNEGYSDIYIDNAASAGPTRDGAMKHIHEVVASWTEISGQNLQKNQWETIEFQITLSDVPVTSGGTARTRIWRKVGNDMVLIANITNQKTLNTATSKCPYMLIFSYWNGGSPKNNTMQADRIVVHFNQATLVETDGSGNKIIGGVKDLTVAPLASFNYNAGDTLATSRAGVTFEGGQTVSTLTGGQENGLEFVYTGGAPDADAQAEMRAHFTGMDEIYVCTRKFIPANYFHRFDGILTVSGSLTNWAVGHTIRGVDGVSTGVISKKSGTSLWVRFPANPYLNEVWVGSITNLSNAEVRTCTARTTEADNNKVFAIWCDDQNLTNDNDGYSNRGASPTVAFECHSTQDKLGGSEIYYHFGADRNVLGDVLPNSTSGASSYITPADFGTWMWEAFRIKMASSESAQDGIIEYWLKRSAESVYTKKFSQTNAKIGKRAAAIPTNSNFKHLYLPGYSNSGFDATTTIRLSRLELYSQKPTFLP